MFFMYWKVQSVSDVALVICGNMIKCVGSTLQVVQISLIFSVDKISETHKQFYFIY